MSQGLCLDRNTRLLVAAPHPDDETLAAGGLIQQALAAGAQLRVVIITDGDNNPWPQRWIEKRCRIDAEARVRWGTRRRNESTAALAHLGVAREDVRHYGWPDQGLTALLMRDSQCEDRLVAEILEFVPNLVVAPSLSDRHPDHNAVRVMLELALQRTPHASCRRLGFVVHGVIDPGDCVTSTMIDEQRQRKQEALQAHVSQLVLSRRRMTRICARAEQFEAREGPSAAAGAIGQRVWQMTYHHRGLRLHQRALYLIIEVGGQVIRATIRLPRSLARTSASTVTDGNSLSILVQLQSVGNTLSVGLTSEHDIDRAFAKVQRLGPRILIYDDYGWVLG